jgi:hypothetical protein
MAVQLVSSLESIIALVLVELCTSKGLASSGPGTFLLRLAIL